MIVSVVMVGRKYLLVWRLVWSGGEKEACGSSQARGMMRGKKKKRKNRRGEGDFMRARGLHGPC
jgi:hypothetical protein